MIAMLDFDGICYGLWKDKEEFLESKKAFPEMYSASLSKELIYREINSLEELKKLMDQALMFQVFGKGEPI
jgi:hypothetical protein